MPSIKKILVFCTSLVSYVFSFYVIGRLMLFLSTPKATSKVYSWVFNLLDIKSRLETAYGPIVLDTIYVIIFILQHSFMKADVVKNLFQKLGLTAAERAIYSLTSSLCLHYLLNNWLSAPSIVLWYVDVQSNRVLWWLFVLLHGLAWFIIYSGSFIMDLPDILGMKQAYYEMRNYRHPSAYKSRELRNLYKHARHPSFVGLTLVLWATNLMTIDRLVLSVLLTTYMYIGWSTDRNDLIYQKYQLKRKIAELKAMF